MLTKPTVGSGPKSSALVVVPTRPLLSGKRSVVPGSPVKTPSPSSAKSPAMLRVPLSRRTVPVLFSSTLSKSVSPSSPLLTSRPALLNDTGVLAPAEPRVR